jgi:hypothetical protein
MMHEREPKMVSTSKDPQPTTFKQPSRRSFLEGGALLLLGGATQLVLTGDALPPARLFSIERVSKHVYAAIAQTAPVVNGNSAIIVTQKGLVVVTCFWCGEILCLLSWNDTGRTMKGQDIVEYAVMLAVILVLVVGTIRLVEAMRTAHFRPQPAQFNNPIRTSNV